MNDKRAYRFFKRAFDILCSFLAIILLALPMLIVAIAIKIDSKGPVFFKQDRIGKNKKIFKMLKFRSMYIDTDPNIPTHLLEDPGSHITKVGAFIRKTSIDELPQLFNIFAGQMSFVGPRPALWNQDDLIAEREKHHANGVKPGLTGLAQISGRDELAIPVKAELDGEYVEKRGFFYDLGLLFKTIFPVLKHEGVVEGERNAVLEPKAKEEQEFVAGVNGVPQTERVNASRRGKSAGTVRSDNKTQEHHYKARQKGNERNRTGLR